jgi:YidC/Oxa1 family membrane protein insertase
MQKNLILAVVLSSLVYIGWYSYIEKKMPQKAPAAQQAQAAAVQAAPQPTAAAASPKNDLLLKEAQALLEEARNESADLEKKGFNIPRRAEKLLVAIKAGKADLLFYAPTASLSSALYQGPVAPVELVPKSGRGFFETSFPALFELKGRTANTAAFSAKLPNGIALTKEFAISPDNGMNSIRITATNVSGRAQILAPWELTVGPGLGTVKSEEKENAKLCKADYTFTEAGRKHPTIKELKDEPAQHDWGWAGLNNRYFLAALVGSNFPETRPVRRFSKVGENEKTPELAIPVPAAELKPGEKRVWEAQFYLGPKDYPLLTKLGFGLDRAVDFGFFAPLAKLANSALVYFHKVTGNYGVAIVILSVIIQLLLTPLSYKSFKAMAVMKKIQPEMQAIQKKYKDDPKRMNTEVMDLYKRHGTNPLGGCLPMLLQIPVFFALFTALRNSWTLHGAPFVFWIKDLSAKDPFYVLPLVMGGIMFLQQHLSPQTSDPSQAAMMKWMPVIFTFMFLTFPSGLVLYWLINSTWGFAQTMYLQKKLA